MFSPVSVYLLAGMSLRESGCASHSSGCAFECRICNRKVAGSNLGRGYFAPRFNSAFHPSRVGKWVPASAGKAKAGMAHSDCGWTCGCAGKTVKSLENARHTLALLRWWFTTKSRYIKCMNLYLYITQRLLVVSLWNFMEWLEIIQTPIDSILSDLATSPENTLATE